MAGGRLQWVIGPGHAVLWGLLFFCSCANDHARERAAELPHPKTLTPERAAGPVAPGLPARPLRRTLEESPEAGAAGWLRVLAAKQDLPDLAVGVVRDNNQLVIKAAPASAEAAAVLKELGFQAAQSEWQLRVPENRLVEFQNQLVAKVDAATKALQAQRGRLEEKGRGAVLGKNPATGTWRSGKLIYTGEPLDIAMSDCDSQPRLFVVVERVDGSERGSRPLLLRGGRLFVNADGFLRIEQFTPQGFWQKLPAWVEQLAISADGRVLAQKPDGVIEELGRLQIVRASSVVSAEGCYEAAPGAAADPAAREETLILAGHLEVAPMDLPREVETYTQAATARLCAATLATAIFRLRPALPSAPVSVQASEENGGARGGKPEALVIHAQLPWAEAHFKALGIAVERLPGRTVIGGEVEAGALAAAAATVLDGILLKLSLHEQNLRNAERVRDAENNLNPYRRKMVNIGPKGEAVEGLDAAPFPTVYKPGDPNADADGNVKLPNVNKAVETAEFAATIAEYKLVRAALERLAPFQIFPEAPGLPAKE